jgi:hypothetical protein
MTSLNAEQWTPERRVWQRTQWINGPKRGKVENIKTFAEFHRRRVEIFA